MFYHDCACYDAIYRLYYVRSVREPIEERKKEQQEYGVFYDDDYNYLQHLKPRTDTSLEPLPSNVTVVEAKKSDLKKACLMQNM